MTSLIIREFNVRFWLNKLASISIKFENSLSIHYKISQTYFQPLENNVGKRGKNADKNGRPGSLIAALLF